MKTVTTLLSCMICYGVHGQDTLKVDTSGKLLAEVTVSATRLRESILLSPVSIQKVGDRFFRLAPATAFPSICIIRPSRTNTGCGRIHRPGSITTGPVSA